ncbi:MAG TPA: tripartite tricarboxylate transporter TctB family protein [Terriglobia bacterium]|nr:tripartite tricarboxylate transporter TctB family protein [Terriglobia bacterium]
MAAAAAALGVALLARIPAIGLGAGYDRIGPRFFPYAVAGGLLVLAGWLALAFLLARRKKGPHRPPVPAAGSLQWPSLGYLVLALVLNLALLERAGFIIAGSVQFWLAARAFHSQKPGRDALVAVALSSIVYFSFSHLLGLTLPAGIFEGLF